MKANELRIGSIVKSLVNDEDFSIVEEIGHRASLGHYVSLNNQHSGVWLVHQERELILGIPLTEEWLLKMGGKKVNNLDWCIMFGGIEFYCRYNKFWYCSIGSVYLSDRIQFVHQVQNLYFSITNKELTIM
jgi:hypothetical protein